MVVGLQIHSPALGYVIPPTEKVTNSHQESLWELTHHSTTFVTNVYPLGIHPYGITHKTLSVPPS